MRKFAMNLFKGVTDKRWNVWSLKEGHSFRGTITKDYPLDTRQHRRARLFQEKFNEASKYQIPRRIRRKIARATAKREWLIQNAVIRKGA